MDVLNILMMFMDVYGKYFELNDYECLDDLLMVCWFCISGVSFISKGNSVQTFNFSLCMCLGGAFKV